MKEPTNYLGIDPGLRHTGVCLLREEAAPTFYQINTNKMSVLEAANYLKLEFRNFCETYGLLGDTVFCVEKQLSVGASMSALMFHVQMQITQAIAEFVPAESPPKMVSPLPVQLTSYMKRMGVPTKPDSATVRHFKETTGHHRSRVSIHCVDAYYLARLAKAVIAGTWKYKLQKKETRLYPWEIINGE